MAPGVSQLVVPSIAFANLANRNLLGLLPPAASLDMIVSKGVRPTGPRSQSMPLQPWEERNLLLDDLRVPLLPPITGEHGVAPAIGILPAAQTKGEREGRVFRFSAVRRGLVGGQ